MRISIEVLEKIANECGSFEIGDGYTYGQLTLRFGYWRKVNLETLQTLIPQNLEIELNLVDDDEDCGELYNYIITPRGVA